MTAREQLPGYWTDRLEKQLLALGYPVREDIMDALSHVTEEEDQGPYGHVCFFAAYDAMRRGLRDETVNYLMEAIRCMTGTCQEKHVARCYNMLGVIAYGQNNLPLAMEQYELAAEYAVRYHRDMVHSMILCNMAEAYYRMGAYKRALQCYASCIREFEQTGEESADGLYNFQVMIAGYGYNLVMLDRLPEALDTAGRLREILKCGTRQPGQPFAGLNIYTFLALLYNKTGDQKLSDTYMEMAVSEVREREQNISEINDLLNLFNFLVMTGRYDRLDEVLKLVEPRITKDGNDGFLLQLLLYRLKYCSHGMAEEEYLAYTQRFFRLKEKTERDENSQVLQMLELRNRLRDISQEHREIRNRNSELLYQAEHDIVSGLANRGGLNRHLEVVFDEAKKKKTALGILFIDIDYFKELNDRYGHQRGDLCIAKTAAVIREAVPDDFAARYGGDEFVVVMRNPQPEEISEAAERISFSLRKLALPNEDAEEGIVTVTIGAMRAIPLKTNKVWDFLTAADEALYEQKRHRRGVFHYREGLDARF